MSRAYYNEIDPYAAQWLRNLIDAGHIAPGDVDTRSIVDVQPSDLAGYTQCHFFAGIGGWSLAARLAGFADDRPLWTGSCPCQPFSSATRGRGEGFGGGGDLWPVWFRLIAAMRPDVVFGEQVASSGSWTDRAADDLEAIGYAFWPTQLPALAVGADHLRYRQWFTSHPNSNSEPRCAEHAEASGVQGRGSFAGRVGASHGVSPRVAQLRAYGNAIVPQVAAEVIGAYLDSRAANDNSPYRAAA